MVNTTTRLKAVLVTLGGIVTIGLAYAVYLVTFAGPDLRVRELQGTKLVDVQFLGEYFSTISRFELRDISTGQVVWAAVPEAGEMHVWTFKLNLGPNPAQAGLKEPLHVAIPALCEEFVTIPGHPYQLTVWGSNGWGGHGKSRATFRWPS